MSEQTREQSDIELLGNALLTAADDLDKAANQFAGLVSGSRNVARFAEKAAWARSVALDVLADPSQRQIRL